MNAQSRILLFYLCLLTALPISAQTGKFYSTGEGLSSTLINQIYQDRRGYIWVATEYGLNKFDGLRFTVYRQIEGDSTSLKNNYVRSLYEDSNRNLLVGCIDGLLYYIPDTDSFREIPMYRSGKRVYPHVTRMLLMSSGELWIVTAGQGIFRLDEQYGRAYSIEALMKKINYNFLSYLYEDSYHNVWIGTEGNGLACYMPQTDEVRLYKKPQLGDNNISAIAEDRYGNLFVGMQTQGLARYDRANDRFVSITASNNAPFSVYTLLPAGENLLIGADGQGLKRYNRVTEKVEDYYISNAPLNFSQEKIHAILEDRDKNVWLGLFQKGLALMPRLETPFGYYGEKSVMGNPIGQGCVMSIYRDTKGLLWVGADNEGLYCLDATGKRLKHFKPGASSHSVPGTVMCMFEDSQGTFWLGSYTNGLARLDRQTGECDYPLPITGEKVLSITEDHRKNLYIATLGSGFFRYDLQTKELKHYESSREETGNTSLNELPNDYVNYVFCDSEGLLWLGHYKGVTCFNPQEESFLTYHKSNTLIENRVGYVITEDHIGNIWAGTADGLYRFDKRTASLKRFITEDGLSNNVICGICEDKRQGLWISTYNGISHYDTGKERFINYYAGDGLQGNEFTHGAFFNDNAGTLYFGGTDGITHFRPASIGSVGKDTHVRITDFYIFDRPVHRNTRSGNHPVVFSAVPSADVFKLSHKDNTFTLNFSTLQYSNPEQIAYEYRMEELGKRWLTTDQGVNRVTYNNLAPGRYTFHVRAVNHGEYSVVRTVRIIITPPWYEMWWAYAIYIAILCLLLTGVVNYILTRFRHRKEMMQSEHAQQLNEAKLQFFINISHEIRTPMTLIMSPLEKLMSETVDEEHHKMYLMMYRNAQRILRLINQLMDIRKLDKGQMHLKFRETDMVGFIEDAMLPFEHLAKKKKIRFSFLHAMPHMKVWIDLNNFDKVLINLFSNAFKYTPESGSIMVELAYGSDDTRKDALRDYVEITVSDSGIGIEAEHLERIFDRFYQVNNDVTKANFGTGIGLHLSRSLVELHHGVLFAENRVNREGSRFIIRIPQGSVHLRPDELEHTDDTEGGQVLTASHALPSSHYLESDVADAEAEKTGVHAKTRYRILIADDEAEIRSYVKEVLSDEYRITTCANGREAYELLLSDTPDLLISDVMMPELDGISLCKKVKQNPNINHVPIILLTAKTAPEDKLEGMATGADAYISKPFSVELLRTTVANLLDNRSLLKSKFSGVQGQEDKIEKIMLTSSDEALMAKIMKVINENLNNPDLSVGLLAEQVGLSRVHVHRKLKELTHFSTRDFIRNVRLKQAAALLSQKKLTISEVCYATGFGNLSHFSTQFKNMYGMTPKEYMQAHRQGEEEEERKS